MERHVDAPGIISPSCRDLIHELNQRCREQWDRAERLQVELNDIRSSRAWFIFRWLRAMRRLFLPVSRLSASPEVTNVSQPLAIPSWQVARMVTSKVSIVIPFHDPLGLLTNGPLRPRTRT